MSWMDDPGTLLGGLLTGLVFGFLLQKGQVARYRVIIGQFLFVDYTVLKIMFTAIVVGAIGVWTMLGLGMIEHLQVKAAQLAANAVGGLIFGVGMATLGYCPGTGVAAMGEGSRHAAVGVLGMIVGAGVFAAAYPALSEGLMKVGDLGKVTFVDLTGVPAGVFITGLAIAAGLSFTAIRRWETQRAAA
jgi:uncharacterized membrane protein YedE/YeeE